MKANQAKARETMVAELKRQFDDLSALGWCAKAEMEEAKEELKTLSYIELTVVYSAFKD